MGRKDNRKSEIIKTVPCNYGGFVRRRNPARRAAASDSGKYLRPCAVLALLMTGALKLDAVEDAGKFMIEIMAGVMFIPAGVGLMESWGELKAVLVPVLVITLVSTIVVMVVSGRVTQAVIRLEKKQQRRGRKMTNMLCESAFFLAVVTAFWRMSSACC